MYKLGYLILLAGGSIVEITHLTGSELYVPELIYLVGFFFVLSSKIVNWIWYPGWYTIAIISIAGYLLKFYDHYNIFIRIADSVICLLIFAKCLHFIQNSPDNIQVITKEPNTN